MGKPVQTHVPSVDPTIDAILKDPEGYFRKQRRLSRWSDLRSDLKYIVRSLVR